MRLPIGKAVVSPLLVGRDAQHESLEHALDGIAAGQGQTILISGEAGIGKSRLVAEAKASAARRGFALLEGHCFEPDRASPYAPLADLLRARFAHLRPTEMAHALGSTSPELVTLIPDLLPQLAEPASTPPLAPEQEQRRLVLALLRFVTGLAADQPLVVLIEDLHWSDDTSLEVLLRLARRVPSLPILLLLTYRSDEPHPTLPHVLAELDRERLATELALPRLAPDEVEAMLRAIFALDRPLRAEFSIAINELCEGNPFFIEEVVTSLVASGDIVHTASGWERKPLDRLRIPRTVSDAVRRRSAALSPAAAETLALAAVAGQRFGFALLHALREGDENDLLDAIKELIAARLIVEVSAEQFAFRHALTRQAISTGLLARERVRSHQRIGETLERVYATVLDAHLEDLAYHYHAAEVWPKALDFGQRAGARALAVYAPRSAIEHYSRALEAARHLTGESPSALLLGRGHAYATLGEFAPAKDDFEAVLLAAEAAGDCRGERQALLALGSVLSGHDYAVAGDHFVRAVAIAREAGEPAHLAHALNRLGNWHLNVEQPLAGRRFHEEALAIFRGLDDRRGIAESLDLLGLASNMASDLAQSAAYYEQAVALFEVLGDRQGLVSSLSVLADRGDGYFHDTVAPPVMDLAAPVADAERALEIARETGWRAGEAYALAILGVVLGPRGHYGRALTVLDESLALAAEIEHREWMIGALCGLGAAHRDLLAFSTAREHLEQALDLARALRSPYWTHGAAGLLAATCIAANDVAGAKAVLAGLDFDSDMQTVGRRLCWCARGDLALAHGDPDRALQIVDRLVAASPPPAGRVVPRLWRLRAAALTMLGRPEDAESALRAAADAAAEYGLRPMLWQIHRSLGDLSLATTRRADAAREFASARATIVALADEIPGDSLRASFVAQASALLPPGSAPTPRQLFRDAFGGLTARERQVANLVAQGDSNRAIADELFISERTVEVHVRNILVKLGFTSRAQIAAWAVERGLALPDT